MNPRKMIGELPGTLEARERSTLETRASVNVADAMTLDEALRRADELEQWTYCYCAGARDFEAVKFLAAFARATIAGEG